MKKYVIIMGLILGGWLGLSGGAQAQVCRVESTGIRFGVFNPLDYGFLDGEGAFTVKCNNPGQNALDVTICIGLRAGSAGTIRDRRMTSGAHMLKYQLYQDPNRRYQWGVILGARPGRWLFTGSIPAHSGFTDIKTQPLYGRIFSGQEHIPPGSYHAQFIFPGQIELYYGFGKTAYCSVAGNYDPDAFSDFSIEASVSPECEIMANPTPLDFGTISGLNVPNATARTHVDIRCTVGTVYHVSLDDGLHSPAPGQRRMQNSSNPDHYIDYDIYSDSGLTQRWGSRAAGEAHQDGPVTGIGVDPQTFTGYGKVPEQIAPSMGVYQDRVILTVDY